MFILDSLLVGSLRFVLDKVVAAAEAELQDDSALREQLLEAQMRSSSARSPTRSSPRSSATCWPRIREIKGRQQGPISMSPDDKITGVDIESYDDEDQ